MAKVNVIVEKGITMDQVMTVIDNKIMESSVNLQEVVESNLLLLYMRTPRCRYIVARTDSFYELAKQIPDCNAIRVPKVEDLDRPAQVLDLIACMLVERYGLSIALKGGYMLSKRVPSPRFTHDVDLSINSLELYKDVKNTLIEIGDVLLGTGDIDEIVAKEDMAPGRSGGIDYKFNGSVLYGVDVNYANIEYGIIKANITDGIQSVQFANERMLGDKISVMASPKRFRRSKDLYDISCIITRFDIDYELLDLCLLKRNAESSLDISKAVLTEQQLIELEKAWNNFKMRSLKDETKFLDKPDIFALYELFIKFINPWILGERKDYWSCSSLEWR